MVDGIEAQEDKLLSLERKLAYTEKELARYKSLGLNEVHLKRLNQLDSFYRGFVHILDMKESLSPTLIVGKMEKLLGDYKWIYNVQPTEKD